MQRDCRGRSQRPSLAKAEKDAASRLFPEAMEASREPVNKHWVLVFAFLPVYDLLGRAGRIGGCIGVFVTVPIGLGALMYGYEIIFTSAEAQGG